MGHRLLYVFLFFVSLSAAADCTSQWEEFSSEPYEEIAFPDTSVHYWRYRFEIESPSSISFRIKGKVPNARYYNFNVYDQKTMDSSGSLADTAIEKDSQDSNAYTVWVVPPGTKTDGQKNTLELPTPRRVRATQLAEIWYREYLQKGETVLPTIEAFDSKTKAPVACPKHTTSVPPLWKALGNKPPRIDRVWFFRAKGQALYANPDNHYIVSRLDLSQNKIAVFRVKAPKFKDEVRYWSFCVGGLSTLTSECLVDENAPLDQNGYFTLVVGPESMRKAVAKRKVGFLAKPFFKFPVVIYRNLLSKENFAGNFVQIPKWTADADPREFAAHRFVGEYGPEGVFCPIAEFQNDLASENSTLCGIRAGDSF